MNSEPKATFAIMADELRALLKFTDEEHEGTHVDKTRLHFVDGDLIAFNSFRLIRRNVYAPCGGLHVCMPGAALAQFIAASQPEEPVDITIWDEQALITCGEFRFMPALTAPEKITAAGIAKLYPDIPPVFECAVTAGVFLDFMGLTGLSERILLRFFSQKLPIEFAAGKLSGLIMPALFEQKQDWRPWEEAKAVPGE